MKTRIAVLLAAIALVWLVVPTTSPAGASPTGQRRFFSDLSITSYNSGAGLTVDQAGSGSVLTLKDGGSSEYTFDQSGATFLNPLTMGVLVASTAAPVAGVASTPIALGGILQPVSMATAGTVPLTIPDAGKIVCFYNTGSQAVSIDDTSTQVLSTGGTPMPLGQYDVLCGFSDGTRFIQFATSNN